MNESETQANEAGESVEDRILSKLAGLPAAESAEPEPVSDGLEDLDWEGQTLKVPKGLKEAVLRTDDYTRKTQELASQRKLYETALERTNAAALEKAFMESTAQESQQLHVIDAYLAQMGKVDMANMPVEQMLRHRLEIDSIREQKQTLLDSLGQKRAQFKEQMQARIQELRGKSRELASKSISGFNEDTEKAIRTFGVAEGLTEAELDNVLLDPRSYKILWKALQFEQVKAGTQKVDGKTERVLRPGAAGERLPAKTADKLNFHKAMKAAGDNSAAKARVIEQRLAGVFAKGQ